MFEQAEKPRVNYGIYHSVTLPLPKRGTGNTPRGEIMEWSLFGPSFDFFYNVTIDLLDLVM